MASMNLNFGALKRGQRISKVKVDPRLRERIDTGLPFLNMVKSGDADEKGLTPSEVILFTGTPGAGKSTMSLQLASALADRGHSVLLNGVEESPAQVKITYERMGLTGDFTIANATFMDEVETMNKELKKLVGGNTLASHLAHLKATYEKSGGKRTLGTGQYAGMVVIVDSLQAMNDGKYGLATNNKTPIRVLESLCQWAKDEYACVIVIGHVAKSGEFKGDNTLLHMVDSHIHLYVDEVPDSPSCGSRILETRKNRFGPSGIASVLDISRGGLSEHRAGSMSARRV